MAKTPTNQGFSLAELIRSTADEIREARHQPGTADAVMEFKGCELELAVTMKGEAGVGIRFWVVDASTKVAAERVSKVKLSFGPIAGQSPGQFTVQTDDGKGPENPRRKE